MLRKMEVEMWKDKTSGSIGTAVNIGTGNCLYRYIGRYKE